MLFSSEHSLITLFHQSLMKCIWHFISYSSIQSAFWASLYNKIQERLWFDFSGGKHFLKWLRNWYAETRCMTWPTHIWVNLIISCHHWWNKINVTPSGSSRSWAAMSWGNAHKAQVGSNIGLVSHTLALLYPLSVSLFPLSTVAMAPSDLRQQCLDRKL